VNLSTTTTTAMGSSPLGNGSEIGFENVGEAARLNQMSMLWLPGSAATMSGTPLPSKAALTMALSPCLPGTPSRGTGVLKIPVPSVGGVPLGSIEYRHASGRGIVGGGVVEDLGRCMIVDEIAQDHAGWTAARVVSRRGGKFSPAWTRSELRTSFPPFTVATPKSSQATVIWLVPASS
jgi:hypothetical protein